MHYNYKKFDFVKITNHCFFFSRSFIEDWELLNQNLEESKFIPEKSPSTKNKDELKSFINCISSIDSVLENRTASYWWAMESVDCVENDSTLLQAVDEPIEEEKLSEDEKLNAAFVAGMIIGGCFVMSFMFQS